MEIKRLELVIFLIIFVGLSVLTFYVFQPFLSIMVLAAVLSILLHPLYEKLVSSFHGGRSFMACLLVFVALIFLIIPVLLLGIQIFAQAQSFFSLNEAGQGQYIQTIQDNVDVLIRHVVPSFSFNLSSSIDYAWGFISGNLANLLSQTTYIFFQIFFLLFALFFFLRDGQKMVHTLMSLSPFDEEQNKQAIGAASRMITSVVRGTIFVGLIRFVCIVVAFYLFGIPNAFLWGVLGGIIGMIPGLGVPFAIIPACIYLLFYSHIWLAVGMALFGMAIAFFIDNMLSAYFFGKGTTIQSPFILFSILGGIAFFGPLGFIFGPIVLSLFVSVVDIYKILILKRHIAG